MKLFITAAAIALTASSVAYADQGYANDTVSTRNVVAATYQDNRDRGQFPTDTLSVTVGQKSVVDAVGYQTERDLGLYQDEAVNVYTFSGQPADTYPSLR
ncbi:hypothetical protein TG4357_01713 [Thalassovita gelatinovora]|uniref:Uncharacterized protein n=1 Tax=Thalassovita gelatinovora TaxID=53501 RepID=A0A0P1FAT7_THAGE|nr:hypothetical protein [Thalassovita gelatinovora]QIZ80638.1 hypothetical protein HFZ77_09175 [Thalassovita gelatinovora]CUH65192.1 hypothetical protein TG4357_01713 [Thalassovita gelatinovora]SEQ87210.1 hypothetical protein SAMN04488043_1101 [Thalassovita gelatinovora]